MLMLTYSALSFKLESASQHKNSSMDALFRPSRLWTCSSWSRSRTFRCTCTEMYGPNLQAASSASLRDPWSSLLKVQTKRQLLLHFQLRSMEQLPNQTEVSTSWISSGNSMWSLLSNPRLLLTAFKSASRAFSSIRGSVTMIQFVSHLCPLKIIRTWTRYRHSSACSRSILSLSLIWMCTRDPVGTMRHSYLRL